VPKLRSQVAGRGDPSHLGAHINLPCLNWLRFDKLVKEREPQLLSLLQNKRQHMNAFNVARGMLSSVFSVAKYIIIYFLRLGRWCWDRIRLR